MNYFIFKIPNSNFVAWVPEHLRLKRLPEIGGTVLGNTPSVHCVGLSGSVLKFEYGKIFEKNWPPNLTSP